MIDSTETYWFIPNQNHLICKRYDDFVHSQCGRIHRFITRNELPAGFPDCQLSGRQEYLNVKTEDFVEAKGNFYPIEHSPTCQYK